MRATVIVEGTHIALPNETLFFGLHLQNIEPGITRISVNFY